MYRNYGDVNFFERGVLVDDEHLENEISIIRCEPYQDVENKYQFGELIVDINDSWIDKEKVMSYIGMKQEEFDKIQFAIGCTDYYDWENFGANLHDANWRDVDREYIENFLNNRLIASDGLEMPWKDDPVTWICTDEDELQHCRHLSGRVYQLIGLEKNSAQNRKSDYGCVFETTIDLDSFTKEQIEDMVKPYYADGTSEIEDIDKDQIIAEIIFETLGIEEADSRAYVDSEEEAKTVIKNFIWLREGVLI